MPDSARRALVIGEALIDIIEQQGIEHVGGSPLNVAVGLARLGRDVDFLTHIGDDAHGRLIADYVKRSGAQLIPESHGAGRTPTAEARMGADGSVSYTFDLQWEVSGTAPVAPPVLVHTGSIAAVRDPGCLAVAALVDTYHTSATVSFDPNVRPSLIIDRDLATERIERLVDRSDVVKASDEDLRWLYPGRTPEQTAKSWLASGPAIVAVTMDEHGALGYCAAGQARVSAGRVRVVDTIGAGDAFTAALLDVLWGLGLLGAHRRPDLHHVGLDALTAALRAGARASALTVARTGADLPDRASLNTQSDSQA